MKSFKTLCKRLGYSEEKIEKIAEEAEKYYKPFVIEQVKRNGEIKLRNIAPSYGALKWVQNRINSRLLVELINNSPTKRYLYGGIKGRSNIQNAKIHQGKKYHLCTDLRGYFDYIDYKIVYQMFIDFGYSPNNARYLTKLTTYKGHVPQGAATSTSISNLVFHNVDMELIEICKANHIVYSRFVDDLTFSSQQDFKSISINLLEIIKQHGFRISHEKTFYSDKPVEVTGTVVKQNGLDVTNKFKNKDVSNACEASLKGRITYENLVKYGTAKQFV